MAELDTRGESWTWRQALKRAAQVLQEEGVKSLWFKALGETVYRRAILMELPLDGPIADAAARVRVDIGMLKATEVDEYVAYRPDVDATEIRRRLEAGHICFVCRHEGRLVADSWVAHRLAWLDYLSREIPLAPDEVYSYGAFTLPGYRGLNIARARILHLVRFFQQAGYRRCVAIVMPENRPGVAMLKACYRPFGVMGYMKLGPWRRDFCRVRRGALPPGAPASAHGPAYWSGVAQQMKDKPHYLDQFLGNLKRETYLALIRRWARVPRGLILKTDLFEEAVGPDAFLVDIPNAGGTAVGVDISPATTIQAKGRAANRTCHYVVADIRSLPFADSTFPLIVSPSTLDHFADPSDLGKSLRELARVLEPGGRLIITLDNSDNVFNPLLRLARGLGLMPYYIGRSYRVSELRAELEAAGLVVEDTTAILHNPRLVAVLAVGVANRIGWQPLTKLVRGALVRSQRLEGTRWKYRTGSFVAALAVRPDVAETGSAG